LKKITIYLFYVWLLLLPLSWVIAAYLPIIAPDKLLAPLLLLLGLVVTVRAPRFQTNRVIFYALMATALLVVKNISFVKSGAIYATLMWNDAIRLGYFLIPLLCIQNIRQFRKSAWIVVLIAMAGCISAFLVSVGLLTLPIERFEASRLDVEVLRKAVGLFPSYGDLAQYIAFAALWVIATPGADEKKRFKIRAMRYIVTLSILIGVLGTQSRNIVLSLVVAAIIYWVFNRIQRAKKKFRSNVSMFITSISLIFISILGFFAIDLIRALSGVGGDYAANTANARLEQYGIAWDIISSSPVLGANLSTYQRMGTFIEGIHNIWLRLAAHGGILSVLILATLLAKIFLDIRRASHIDVKAKDALVATGYFSALVVATMFYVGMEEMFWALLGIVTALTCIGPTSSASRQKFSSKFVI